MRKTAIEALVENAENVKDNPDYHVAATFPDGSYINAPILKVGPNWASFGGLGEDAVIVDMTGAVLEIDWTPGHPLATGERFSNLSSRAPGF